MSTTKLSLNKGFTLIETAFGVLILSLVITGIGALYKQGIDVEQLKEQRQQVKTIHDAINTFLRVNHYLPCPDTDGDGEEDRRRPSGDKSVCDEPEGTLPYKDIGVSGLDAWQNPYYYRVNSRADDSDYINDICEPASVMGFEGSYDLGDLELCDSSNIYYCDNKCSDLSPACSGSCENVDPRVNVDTSGDGVADAPGPPYFHLATPPYGSLKGFGNLNIEDDNGNSLGSGIVAVVISWGEDGDAVNDSNCSSGVENEENCDGDTDFVDTRTGEERDFLTWVTVNQAKAAIISQRKFR